MSTKSLWMPVMKVLEKELDIYALLYYENRQNTFDLFYLNVCYTKLVLTVVFILN